MVSKTPSKYKYPSVLFKNLKLDFKIYLHISYNTNALKARTQSDRKKKKWESWIALL